MAQFSLGNTYSLSTLAPGILGARFERAKLSGMIGYKAANSFIQVDSLHRAIYPMLPVGTPVSPAGFTFYMFTLENGSTKVLADNWIDMSSVTHITSVNLLINVQVDNASEVEKVRESLTLLGYRNFTIEIT